MHEIVTLQIGEAANYLGTHFWNTQESYFTYDAQQESPVNHDCHFRPGIGADGSETYTPRTLIYDFKSRFGTLRKLNELYQTEEDDGSHAFASSSNSNNTILQREPGIPIHEYQQALNEGVDPPPLNTHNVRFWSDFNRVFYGPKSIVQIYEDEFSPQPTRFHSWSHGEELFETLSRTSDPLDDDLRPLVEECDQMQGMQMLSPVDDGWGGFASRYIDALRDEYGKSMLWVWALNSKVTATRSEQRATTVNQAHSLANISPQASVYIPMQRSPTVTPEYLNVDNTSLWSTSAVQCCAFETATLPCRLKPSLDHCSASLDDMCMALGTDEYRRVAQLGFRLQPYGSESGMTNGTSHEKHSPPAKCDLFPYHGNNQVQNHHDDHNRLDVLRGSHLDELVEESQTLSATEVRLKSRLAFPVLDSFPSLYSEDVLKPNTFSISTALTKSSIISSWARYLESGSRLHFGIDEREALSDGLKQIASAYDSSDSASDDEDWDD